MDRNLKFVIFSVALVGVACLSWLTLASSRQVRSAKAEHASSSAFDRETRRQINLRIKSAESTGNLGALESSHHDMVVASGASPLAYDRLAHVLLREGKDRDAWDALSHAMNTPGWKAAAPTNSLVAYAELSERFGTKANALSSYEAVVKDGRLPVEGWPSAHLTFNQTKALAYLVSAAKHGRSVEYDAAEVDYLKAAEIAPDWDEVQLQVGIGLRGIRRAPEIVSKALALAGKSSNKRIHLAAIAPHHEGLTGAERKSSSRKGIGPDNGVVFPPPVDFH